MLRIISVVFGLIFGGVFAGAGIFASSQTVVPMYLSWSEAKSWQPISAQILSVSSTNSSVSAKYTYAFKGEVFQNDRVYLADFSDNIGSYHSKLYTKLHRAQQNGTSVEVWVNPARPNESVLDRSMRWGLFSAMCAFFSIFIFIGVFVMYSSFSAPKIKRSSRPSILALRKEWKSKREGTESFVSFLGKYRSERQKQPKASKTENGNIHLDWKGRKGWQSSKIRSSAKSGTMVMWFFAIFWNAVSYSISFVAFNDWNRHDYGALFVLIFPLAGLFLLYQAIKLSREYNRFGIIELDMDPYPGSIGGNIGGTLKIDDLSSWDSKFIVSAECGYSYVSGSGKNRSRNERIHWAEEGLAKASRVGKSILLKFCFTVPEGLPEADVVQSGDYHFWRVKVRAELPGVDLNRSYNIPVFATGETSQGFLHDISEQVEENRQQEEDTARAAIERGKFEDTALAKSMRIEKLDRGLLLSFPMFRNKIITLFGVIFGGGFSFATYSMVSSFGGGLFGIISLLFSLPFAAVGLIGMTAAVYFPLNNMRVRIENKEVTVLRRLLFMPIFYKKVGKHEIRSLTLTRTGSTGSGTKKIEHYKIVAHLQDGKSLTIAESIDGKELAEPLKDYLFRKIQSC